MMTYNTVTFCLTVSRYLSLWLYLLCFILTPAIRCFGPVSRSEYWSHLPPRLDIAGLDIYKYLPVTLNTTYLFTSAFLWLNLSKLYIRGRC